MAALSPMGPVSTPKLLSESALLMKQWVKASPETIRFLSGRNQVDMVLLLTASGPSLVLKEQTQGAFRYNKVTYYDVTFGNLLLAKALKNHGKIQAVFHDVVSEWVSQGCRCVFLGTRRRQVREGLVEEVLNSPQVVSLRKALISQATRAREWVVMSHDATYQTLFTIIGQECMAQKPGESHALHSFVGRTGCVPGFSLQHTEDKACFRGAVSQVLPAEARASCKFVFSDSPTTVQAAGDALPNLVGVGEDGLHLVLRIEACTGEKRTAMSAHVLRLQLKFRQPLEGSLYQAGSAGDGAEGAWQDVRVDRDWDVYGKRPYVEHQDYLDDLATVCQLYPEFMRRKDHKGRSVREILKAGGSRNHFLYLRNGSHIIWHLQKMFPEQEMELLSWGTCSNEALHFQLKHVQRPVVQQHLEQVPVKLAAFSLGKLLCHNVAAYHPTLAQRGSAEILSLIEGRVRQGFFEGPTEAVIAQATSIQGLRKPAHPLDARKSKLRAEVAASQQARWRTEEKKRAAKDAKRQVPKKSAQVKKRTVFSKKK